MNRLIDVSLAMDGPIWIASVLLDREIELSCIAGATLRETDGNRLACRITIRARRRRSEWILPIIFVGIAIALLTLKLRFAS